MSAWYLPFCSIVGLPDTAVTGSLARLPEDRKAGRERGSLDTWNPPACLGTRVPNTSGSQRVYASGSTEGPEGVGHHTCWSEVGLKSAFLGRSPVMPTGVVQGSSPRTPALDHPGAAATY